MLKNRGYHLVTPSISNPDPDEELKIFEIIRRNIPVLVKDIFPQCEVDLIPLCFHHADNVMPAIGIYCNDDSIDVYTEDLNEIVDSWVDNYGVDKILELAKDVEIPSWENIRERGAYPYKFGA